MTDRPEQDPMQAGLDNLQTAYVAWKVGQDRVDRGEITEEQLQGIVAVGSRAVRALVELPGFADRALADVQRVADTDARVTGFTQLTAGIDDDPEFSATRDRMEQLLRRHAPLGRTAISWGLRHGVGLQTCGEVETYFSRTYEIEALNFMIPEGAVLPRVGLLFTPTTVVFTDSPDSVETRSVEYLAKRYDDKIITQTDSGPITLSGMRREVTLRTLQYFQQDPAASLGNAHFREIVREVIGDDHGRQEFMTLYRSIREWWERSLSWNESPIIQRTGGGTGPNGTMSFALNPDALPLSVSTQQAS
jgi:hypothetical protein